MGMFFTLLYVLTAFIGPQVLFGDLAQYRIELIIALSAMVTSLPLVEDFGLMEIPQTYALIGLCASVTMSIIFTGWLSQAPVVLLGFLPSAMAFFLVALNCKRKIHLQLLVAALAVSAFVVIFRGFLAERIGDSDSIYLLIMKNSAGEDFYRLRGVTILNDPNDFAQFLIGLIPCMFFLWARGKAFRNFFLVYIPVAILIFGMFLTHSRGGMIALMVSAIVAGRRKIGVMPAIVGGIVLFAVLSAVGWSGGRDVSADSGADRMAAWSAGLVLIRTHPLFGVGISRFTDYNELTAHNSVVVCAAELGLLGFFSWMLLIAPTMRDVVVAGRDAEEEARKKALEDAYHPLAFRRNAPLIVPASLASATTGIAPAVIAKEVPTSVRRIVTGVVGDIKDMPTIADPFAPPEVEEDAPMPVSTSRRKSRSTILKEAAEAKALFNALQVVPLTDKEIHRLANLMLISLAGFFTAGWFLSRAYAMILFVLTGMAAAVYKMARVRGITPPPLPLGRAAKYAGISCVLLLMIVYVIIRFQHV